MLPLSKMFYSVTVRWLNNTLAETTQWIARVAKAEPVRCGWEWAPPACARLEH